MLAAHMTTYTLPNQHVPAPTGDFIIGNWVEFVLNSPQRRRIKTTDLAQVTVVKTFNYVRITR